MKILIYPSVALLSLYAALAAPVANWKEFNPNAAVVPIADAGTASPTFGDGVTLNSSQQAWIGGRFGTVEAPVSVTLGVGETLTVSGTVVFTGGSNDSNQFRFGVFNDGGQFDLNDGNGWAGGWLHSIGTVATSDLWQGRTTGPFISTLPNAVDLDAVKTRTGVFDGDSATPFAFSMSITRDSVTTVDVSSLITGGDGDLSEGYVKEDIATPIFTYTAMGWLFGGSSAVEQVAFSEVEYMVSGGGEARILAVRSDGTTTEIDYEGVEGKFYFLESSLDMVAWDSELEDSISGTGTFTDDLGGRFPDGLPRRVFYRLREMEP